MIDSLARGAYAAGAVSMILIAGLIILDVTVRAAFGASITSVDDMVAYALVLFTFLQLPLMVRQGHLLRVTLLTDCLGLRAQHVLLVFSLAMSAALFAVLALISVEPTYDSFMIGEFRGTGTVRIPVWAVRLAVTALLTVAALSSLTAMIQILRRGSTACVDKAAS